MWRGLLGPVAKDDRLRVCGADFDLSAPRRPQPRRAFDPYYRLIRRAELVPGFPVSGPGGSAALARLVGLDPTTSRFSRRAFFPLNYRRTKGQTTCKIVRLLS